MRGHLFLCLLSLGTDVSQARTADRHLPDGIDAQWTSPAISSKRIGELRPQPHDALVIGVISRTEA